MAKSKDSATSTTSGKADGKDTSEANVDLGAAASEASEQIQAQVSGLTEQARQQANDQLAAGKERLVDTLDTVALLFHQAGEHADLQDKAMLSGYVNKASSQLDQWSDSLRERDVSQLLDDTMQFARRQPMLFFSSALAAGFAGARFLRSSTPKPEQEPAETPTPSTDVAPVTPEASYASVQDAFNSARADADMAQSMDMSMQTDREPMAGDFVEDFKSATLEGDEFSDGAFAGTDTPTSPERR